MCSRIYVETYGLNAPLSITAQHARSVGLTDESLASFESPGEWVGELCVLERGSKRSVSRSDRVMLRLVCDTAALHIRQDLDRPFAILSFSGMSYIMSDMSVMTLDFIKRFSHFKRQAMSGTAVKLTDREGHRFVFKLEKSAGHSGSGRKLSKGVPLSPAPVDKSEWKDMM